MPKYQTLGYSLLLNIMLLQLYSNAKFFFKVWNSSELHVLALTIDKLEALWHQKKLVD